MKKYFKKYYSKMTKIIGVTGGIASGKSSGVQYIKEIGGDQVLIIDADKVGHEVKI